MMDLPGVCWDVSFTDGGFISSLTLYFGLMTIAGALLINNSTKK